MLLALAIAVSSATTPDPALEEQIRRHRTVGTATLIGGTAATAGGLVVLLVGRGPPGGLSTESPTESTLRSMGGAALMIAGFSLTLVGGAELGNAKALERGQVVIAPAPIPGGAAVALAARF